MKDREIRKVLDHNDMSRERKDDMSTRLKGDFTTIHNIPESVRIAQEALAQIEYNHPDDLPVVQGALARILACCICGSKPQSETAIKMKGLSDEQHDKHNRANTSINDGASITSSTNAIHDDTSDYKLEIKDNKKSSNNNQWLEIVYNRERFDFVYQRTIKSLNDAQDILSYKYIIWHRYERSRQSRIQQNY